MMYRINIEKTKVAIRRMSLVTVCFVVMVEVVVVVLLIVLKVV